MSSLRTVRTEFVNASLLAIYAAYLFADLLKDTGEDCSRIVQACQACTKLKKEPNNLNLIAGQSHLRSEVLFSERLDDLFGKNFTPPMGPDDDAAFAVGEPELGNRRCSSVWKPGEIFSAGQSESLQRPRRQEGPTRSGSQDIHAELP
jgi:hypothetical protein